MKILVNGDSNMCGEELEDRSLGVSSQVAQILGADINNLSLSGSSNDRIYNSTMDYIVSQPTPDLVLIGWSEMCRVQWFLDDVHTFGEFVEINNLGVGRREYPEQYTRRLERWHEISNNLEFRIHLSYYWHERIYNLHKFLQSRSIRHLFFHAFHDFKVTDTTDQFNWSNCFMDPYNWDNTYVHWCADQGYKEITPGWYHYEPAGQRAWAERIVDYIKQHNII
jgi:hypothetical protein